MDIVPSDIEDDGLVLTISVTDFDGKYWASVDLQLPDIEDIDVTQFFVLLKGLDMAKGKLQELIENIEDDNDPGE